MSMHGFMESSILDSDVFQGLNKSMKIQEKAVNLIKTAKHLSNEDIEASYIAVRQLTDSLTTAAMKAFDNEQVVLVYNSSPKLSLTQAVPFLTFKTSKGYVTYVFVDKYVTVSRDGVLTIPPAILRDLLTGATVANAIKRNYEKLANNQYLAKILISIYCKMVSRVLNKEFSIAVNKNTFDTIQYWIGRYFLERVYGLNDTPSNIETMARSSIKYLDDLQIQEIKKTYDDANITKFAELLDLIKGISPRMKALNEGVFLNDWINYYYIPSMLGCDNIEYMIFMCITLMSGNNIINISASDIVKEAKGIKGFRAELLKLI